MATTYHTADDDVLAMLRHVLGRHHHQLRDAGVRVGVIMAENPDGPAVKHGGYPSTATIRVVSLKDRLTKGYDAEMLIDERVWNEASSDEQAAILDHELCHLSLVWLAGAKLRKVRDEDPNAPAWEVDDLNRPKLKLVPGDWNAGDGFRVVVERHGRAAVEFTNLDKCYARAKAAAGEEAVSP